MRYFLGTIATLLGILFLSALLLPIFLALAKACWEAPVLAVVLGGLWFAGTRSSGYLADQAWARATFWRK